MTASAAGGRQVEACSSGGSSAPYASSGGRKSAVSDVIYTIGGEESLYRQIATSVSFAGCTDDSFKKMIAVLKEWFVADDSSV